MTNETSGNTSSGRITGIKTKRVRELRERHNLTQEQFAKSLDPQISADMVAKIEQQKKPLSFDIALNIREKYSEASLDWLFGFSNDVNNAADNIIEDLRKVFKLKCVMVTVDTHHDEKQFQLEIEESLDKLLWELDRIERYKEERELPDVVFELWVNKTKQDYNEAHKQNNDRKIIKYCLRGDVDVVDEE